MARPLFLPVGRGLEVSVRGERTEAMLYIAKIKVEEGNEEFSDTEYAVKAVLANVLANAKVYTDRNITRFL